MKSKVDITRVLPYLGDEMGDMSIGGDSARHLEGEQKMYPRNDDNFVRS